MWLSRRCLVIPGHCEDCGLPSRLVELYECLQVCACVHTCGYVCVCVWCLRVCVCGVYEYASIYIHSMGV